MLASVSFVTPAATRSDSSLAGLRTTGRLQREIGELITKLWDVRARAATPALMVLTRQLSAHPPVAPKKATSDWGMAGLCKLSE